jgi:SAM-dependent methyltransferase
LPLAIAGGVIVTLIALNVTGWLTALTYTATLAAALLTVVTLARRPVRFAAGVVFLLLIPVLLGQRALHTERTFFGVLRVESLDRTHRFVHGTTLHGIESFAPGRRDEPLSYYSRQGPIGQIFQRLGDRIHSVGAIGLGAGTIAAYGRPGDRFTFYEIDAAVARIASNPRYFTFLRDSKADIRIVIGDGRLRIAEAPHRTYDLIVLDAFSSDAVPVHLLTREAVELYLGKLRPGGLLAFHISSNYVDLKPVIAGIARALDCSALTQEHHPATRQKRMGASASAWVLVAGDGTSLARLRNDRHWKPLDESAGTTVWTDQFSNVLSVIKWLD